MTDAFGMTVTGTGSTPTPFGFVGQGGYQSDADTGLMLCGHRYYDDSTERFLNRDPVRAGYNWNVYCRDNPVNASDPTGNDETTPPIAPIVPPDTVVLIPPPPIVVPAPVPIVITPGGPTQPGSGPRSAAENPCFAQGQAN